MAEHASSLSFGSSTIISEDPPFSALLTDGLALSGFSPLSQLLPWIDALVKFHFGLGAYFRNRDKRSLSSWFLLETFSADKTIAGDRYRSCEGQSIHINAHFIPYYGKKRSGRGSRINFFNSSRKPQR
jgi:hypothetical protein